MAAVVAARAPRPAKVAVYARPPISERAFQDVVIEYARLNGWIVYHPFDSRHSEAGWPDLALTHEQMGRFLLRELKTDTGRVSAAQTAYHQALRAAGVDVAVWRPRDWSEIEATLYWRRDQSQKRHSA